MYRAAVRVHPALVRVHPVLVRVHLPPFGLGAAGGSHHTITHNFPTNGRILKAFRPLDSL